MSEPLGLIAGWGRFPLLIAQEARRQGLAVVAVGIEGITDHALATEVDSILWTKLGQIDRPLQELKKAGVRRAVMAGRVSHVKVFGGILPDFRAVKLLATLKDRRADTILNAVAAECAKDGIELQSSATYMARYIPAPGFLSKRKPSSAEKKDIELGWTIAKAVAGHDVGQTVVVRQGAIMAVEALEGTDAAILRAGELARAARIEPELVVVKVAKPRQDLRFDLPVIGLDSIKTFKAAGVKALAVQAGQTLILDKEAFLTQADELGIAVCAVKGEEP